MTVANLLRKGSLALLTSVLLLSGGISWLIHDGLAETTYRDAAQTLSSAADQMRDRLDMGMYERWREIRSVAETSTRLRSGSDQEMQSLLDRLQQTFPRYAWIGLTDRQGIVQYSTGDLLKGENVASRPWFTQGLNGPMIGDAHEAVLLAGLVPAFDGDPEEPVRFLDVAAPIIDTKGQVLGVLGSHISWNWTHEVSREVLRSLPGRPVEFLLLSANGQVLLGPRHLRARRLEVGQTSGQQVRMADGEFVMTAIRSRGYRDYPGFGWTIVARMPTEEIDRTLRVFDILLAVSTAISVLHVAVALMLVPGRSAS